MTTAEAIQAMTKELKKLGLNDAATPMGAIEAHSCSIEKAGREIAEAIRELAAAISSIKE